MPSITNVALLLVLLSAVVYSLEINVQKGTALPTLKSARDHIRSLGNLNQPIRVIIHPGIYREKFELSAHDTPDSTMHRVEYVAKSFLDPTAGPSVINGGVSIPNKAFRPIGPGSPLLRADLFAHGVNASSLGKMITGGGVGDCQHTKTDLIFEGERQLLGRWPNKAVDGGWRFANIDSAAGNTATVDTTVQPSGSRILAWAHEADPWLHGYWTFDWTDSYVSIGNITGSSSKPSEISMTQLTPTQIKPNARFYGTNLLVEVDTPGLVLALALALALTPTLRP